jgi:hypothetical protein
LCSQKAPTAIDSRGPSQVLQLRGHRRWLHVGEHYYVVELLGRHVPLHHCLARACFHPRITVGGEAGAAVARAGGCSLGLEEHACRGIHSVIGDNIRADPPHVGDRVLGPGGGEPGIDSLPCSRGSCKCTGCALLLTGATRWVRRPRSISAGLGGVCSDIKERAEASRHPCEDDVAAFSHGSEAGSPELSIYSIAEGVVPGGVAGVAREARRLEVSSSAVDETELPPAIAVCTKGADGLADQRLGPGAAGFAGLCAPAAELPLHAFKLTGV